MLAIFDILPLSWIPKLLKVFKEQVIKFLFKDAYIVSHNHYMKRKLKSHFQDMNGLFKYDLHLENEHFTNDKRPVSKLYLKLIDTNTPCRIEAEVIARNGNVKYSHAINKRVKGDDLVVCSLTDIPLKELSADPDHGIKMTYSSVNIEGKVTFDDGNVSTFQSVNIHPTYTEFLNSRWEFIWGVILNLDYIEAKKQDLREHLIYYMAGGLAYAHAANACNISIIKMLWCRFVVYGLGSKFCVSTLFWAMYELGCIKLSESESQL